MLGITFELLPRGILEPASASSRPVPRKFASGEILHTGVVVRDVEKAARVFADIMGVAPPQPTVDAGRRSVQFPTKLVAIEFVEPAGAESPWQDHLDEFGPSIHHFALRVDDLEKDIAYLEKMGGKVVVGPELRICACRSPTAAVRARVRTERAVEPLSHSQWASSGFAGELFDRMTRIGTTEQVRRRQRHRCGSS